MCKSIEAEKYYFNFFFSECARITFKEWEIEKNFCVTFVGGRGLAKSEGTRV